MKSALLLTFILVLLTLPCQAETTQGAMSIGLGHLTTFADANTIVQLSGGVDMPLSKSLNLTSAPCLRDGCGGLMLVQEPRFGHRVTGASEWKSIT